MSSKYSTKKENDAKYREKNKDKIREYQAAYRAKHKKERKQYNSTYYIENKNKLLENAKEYYEKNTDSILSTKAKYYINNKEKILSSKREYYTRNDESIRDKLNARYNTAEGKYKEIIKSAKYRKIQVKMTKEEIISVTENECFYCGKETTADLRNGIDRMNNDVCYTIHNSVSCCKMCNYMKQCLDPRTFIERCAQISFYHDGPGEITNYWSDVMFKSYKIYRFQITNSRKLDFELTETEYNTLREKECYFCKRRSNEQHSNGIDRVDSNVGYIINNCISCCRDCNVAKKSYSAEEFITKCKLITTRKHNFPDMPRQLIIWGRNK